jgi:hypothetical protein
LVVPKALEVLVLIPICNQGVVGSNPTAGTNVIDNFSFYFVLPNIARGDQAAI